MVISILNQSLCSLELWNWICGLGLELRTDVTLPSHLSQRAVGAFLVDLWGEVLLHRGFLIVMWRHQGVMCGCRRDRASGSLSQRRLCVHLAAQTKLCNTPEEEPCWWGICKERRKTQLSSFSSSSSSTSTSSFLCPPCCNFYEKPTIWWVTREARGAVLLNW